MVEFVTPMGWKSVEAACRDPARVNRHASPNYAPRSAKADAEAQRQVAAWRALDVRVRTQWLASESRRRIVDSHRSCAAAQRLVRQAQRLLKPAQAGVYERYRITQYSTPAQCLPMPATHTFGKEMLRTAQATWSRAQETFIRTQNTRWACGVTRARSQQVVAEAKGLKIKLEGHSRLSAE